MLVGHFGVALLAKRIEPRVSLGTFTIAAMLADLLWPIFLLIGIEHVSFKPGVGAANYIASSKISFSHSLLMDLLWAAILAVAYFWRKRYPRGAWLLFAVVLSHWLLDFVSLAVPLAPGAQHAFGLRLWSSVPATIIIEGGFWLLAIVLYARAFRSKNWVGACAFWVVAALITLVWYNNIAGPTPKQTSALGPLVLFSLLVAWAYWMNRSRIAPSQIGLATAAN